MKCVCKSCNAEIEITDPDGKQIKIVCCRKENHTGPHLSQVTWL